MNSNDDDDELSFPEKLVGAWEILGSTWTLFLLFLQWQQVHTSSMHIKPCCLVITPIKRSFHLILHVESDYHAFSFLAKMIKIMESINKNNWEAFQFKTDQSVQTIGIN